MLWFRELREWLAATQRTMPARHRGLLVGLGAGTVVANRGASPASGSSVRPAIATYVVHHGDTMWSIAATHRGSLSQSDYVDLLVQANGGAALQVGQQIELP